MRFVGKYTIEFFGISKPAFTISAADAARAPAGMLFAVETFGSGESKAGELSVHRRRYADFTQQWRFSISFQLNAQLYVSLHAISSEERPQTRRRGGDFAPGVTQV